MSTDINEAPSDLTPENELEQLILRVNQAWDRRPEPDRPYLVSALGLALSNDLKTIKKLTGLNLTAFLRQYLADRMQLVKSGDHRNVYSLVTPGTAPEEVEQLPVGERRFNRRFWAAFAVPAQSGRRLIDATEFTFEDDDGSLAQVCEGKLVLDTTLIPPETIPNRDETIKIQIKNWLSEKGLNEERFLAKHHPNRDLVPPGIPGSLSVFDLLVSALNKRQLETIHLPLDVVISLQKRRP